MLWAQPNNIGPAEQRSLGLITQTLENGLGIGDELLPCSYGELNTQYSELNCNRNVRRNYRSTQRFSVYSLFHRDRPFNQCTEDLDFSTQELLGARSSLSNLSERDGLYQHMAFQCQEELNTNEDDYNLHVVLLQAAHNLQQKKIEAVALQSMRGLNNIDNIIGRELIEKDIHCNDQISTLVKQSCESFKECERRPGRIRMQAQMTYEALKSTLQIDNMIEQTTEEITNLSSSHNGPGQGQFHEKINELSSIIEDLENSKRDILSTVPWVEGDKFQESLKNFEERIIEDDIDTENNEEQDPIRDTKIQSIVSDIGSSIVDQLGSNRHELLKRYDDATKAMNCLDNQDSCDDYEELIAKAPPIDMTDLENSEDPNRFNAFKLMQANQCIENKSESVRTYRNTTIDIASIGAGFLMGGVGGFVRLASVAGRMYVRGNRIRGLASAAVLGLEGASIANGTRDAINSCSSARHNLSNFQNAEHEVACNGANQQMNVISNYRECLKDVLILSATAIAGFAPDIARSFRRRTTPLNQQSTNIARVDGLLDELDLPYDISPSARETLLNLGIKENELADFSSLLKKMGTTSVDDLESNLIYFNQLSARNRKLFLDNFDTVTNRTPLESGLTLNRLNRLTRMRRSFNRYHNNMLRHEEKVYQRELNKLLESGEASDEAITSARATARRSRLAREERSMGCRASKMTEQHRQGARLFTNFTVAFGLGSTATSYTLANRDRPKNEEFFGDLSYELAMAFIMSKVSAKIQTTPSATLLGRYITSNATNAALGTIYSGVFASIYGISEDEVEDHLQRIQNDPDQMAALARFDEYIEDENIIANIEQSLMDQFEAGLEQPETAEYFNSDEVQIGNQTFAGPINNVTLQDPQLRESIKAAIMAKLYEENSGDWDLGSLFADKYAYDVAYNATVGIPRGMAFGYATYTALCRHADSPATGLSIAMGLQAINQNLGGFLYYEGRRNAVGQ